MRQSSNSGRRLRGRPNRNKPHGGTPNRNSTFESNGPEGKVRGNATQVFEKYLALAREAAAAGNRIGAEAFYQHAEHYFRIMSDSTDPRAEGQQGQFGGRDGQRHSQQPRNGADGDWHGRPYGGDADDDNDTDEPSQPSDSGAKGGGEQAAGDSPNDDRQPRARTPRDQLRRGRTHRHQGGENQRNFDGQSGAGSRQAAPADVAAQNAKEADAPAPGNPKSDSPAADKAGSEAAPEAPAAAAPKEAPEGAVNGAEGETQQRGRGRRAGGNSDGERAPRRGRPRKAAAADKEPSAATGESGESAA